MTHYQESVQRIIDLSLSGMIPADIQKETGFSRSFIYNTRKKKGVTAQLKKEKVERERKVVELSLQGQTAKQISKVTGVHPETVYKIRAKFGAGQKKHSVLTDEAKTQIISLHDKGKSLLSIGKEVGVCRDLIGRFLRDHIERLDRAAAKFALECFPPPSRYLEDKS